jgi:hypothetical protein
MASDRQTQRRQRAVVVLLTLSLLSLPAIALAGHASFTDVPSGGTHSAGIHYVAETGITTGCTPTRYCPNDNLTRAQMGTFIHRLSGNDPKTAPNVNAATVSAAAIPAIPGVFSMPERRLRSRSSSTRSGPSSPRRSSRARSAS